MNAGSKQQIEKEINDIKYDLCNIDHISHPFAVDDFSTHQVSSHHVIAQVFFIQYYFALIC
jgi:hypothetical protein